MPTLRKRSAKTANESTDVSPNSVKKQKVAETSSGIPLAKITRHDKPDFEPLYKAHREQLEKLGLKTEDMIAIRRKIHTHPEGGFKEFETQKVIRASLLGFGIDEADIKDCAGTGLVVDIRGTGESVDNTADGKINSIALRADMDGLPMSENNPHLDYKTTTDHAHMCGHDGHMATILSTA